jgi:hypothetical protein
MSRFVDRNKIELVELGPCQCGDTTKHPMDWVKIRREISHADYLQISDAANLGSEVATRTLMQKRIAEWNLVDDHGRPVPITNRMIADLDTATTEAIIDAIVSVRDEEPEPLPQA